MRDGVGSGLDPVLAVALALVASCVGGGVEVGRGGRGRRRGDAEAGGDGNRRPRGGKRDPPGEREADPLGNLGATREIRAREDEEELLPAPATRKVDVAQRLLEQRGEVAQDGIPG